MICYIFPNPLTTLSSWILEERTWCCSVQVRKVSTCIIMTMKTFCLLMDDSTEHRGQVVNTGALYLLCAGFKP
jgi:hypothetical protein